MLPLPCTLKDCLVVSVEFRRVRRKEQAAFEATWDKIVAEATGFEGFLSATLYQPDWPYEQNYRMVFKFNRMDRLKQWTISEEWKYWQVQIEPLTIKPHPIGAIYCSECCPPPEHF